MALSAAAPVDAQKPLFSLSFSWVCWQRKKKNNRCREKKTREEKKLKAISRRKNANYYKFLSCKQMTHCHSHRQCGIHLIFVFICRKRVVLVLYMCISEIWKKKKEKKNEKKLFFFELVLFAVEWVAFCGSMAGWLAPWSIFARTFITWITLLSTNSFGVAAAVDRSFK